MNSALWGENGQNSPVVIIPHRLQYIFLNAQINVFENVDLFMIGITMESTLSEINLFICV